MKTDYEFIKDKFDASSVKAPESMDEQFVLNKIADIKPKSSRKPLITSLSMAAAVAIVTVAAFVVTSVIGNTPQPLTVLKGSTASLSNFKSSDDIKDALRTIYKDRTDMETYNTEILEDYGVAEDSLSYSKSNTANAAGGAALKGADYGHNSTYTQYTNVDEADTVKTDGKYIYYLEDGSSIAIFSAEGKNSKKIAEIKPIKKPSDFYYNYYSDFYVSGSRLIAIGNVSSKTCKTIVDVYDITDIKNIKNIDSFYQSGSCCSSRMIGDMLYVISNHPANNENDLPKAGKRKGATIDEAARDDIPCVDIYTVEKPSVANFLVVSSIDTSNGAQVKKTKSILGSADTVCCNTEHLFVTAAEYDYSYDSINDIGFWYRSPDYTQIVKVDLNNNLDFTATAKVKGYVDNQYALDEKDGKLRVAVTYSTDRTKADKQINRLYIFDKDLKEIGRTAEFAKDESIKAVRYIGDTAYVITYEETDPLFVIDTKDAENPRILGEVKISGFSTLLVPVNDNTLLGIGYHTQDEADDDIDMEIQEGVKLALFDVSDKANPKVLDEKIFKGYESEVQYNPKALLVNFERNDYTIPYTRWNYEDDDEDSQNGVINFKVDNGKIRIVDEYSSDRFNRNNEDESSDLDRCVYVGDYIYMLGSYYNYETESGKTVIDAVQYK